MSRNIPKPDSYSLFSSYCLALYWRLYCFLCKMLCKSYEEYKSMNALKTFDLKL